MKNHHTLDDGIVHILCKDSKGNQSGIVVIDADDLDSLRERYPKPFTIGLDSKGYAVFKYSNATYKLHRAIMRCTNRWQFIDHKDHNPLNNTKKNLRFSDHVRNGLNRKNFKNKSGIRYIAKTKSGAYAARFVINNKALTVVTVKTKEEAELVSYVLSRVRDIVCS